MHSSFIGYLLQKFAIYSCLFIILYYKHQAHSNLLLFLDKTNPFVLLLFFFFV